jgi:hypothetical protein
MALLGGCRCGACRYTLDYPTAPASYACHCLDCQTMSGASFTLQAIVPLSRFDISGECIEWAHPNSRGDVTTQCFCAVCKTRLYSTNEGRPGTAIIRVGTLDDSSAVIPRLHLWAKRKQKWIGLPPDAEVYDEAIPADRAKVCFATNFA